MSNMLDIDDLQGRMQRGELDSRSGVKGRQPGRRQGPTAATSPVLRSWPPRRSAPRPVPPRVERRMPA